MRSVHPSSFGILYSYDRSTSLAHRGYRGRIIKVTPTEVRVELEAQQRSVGVPRDAIPPEHGGAPLPREPPRFGAAPNTPAHLGMATPNHRWVRLLCLTCWIVVVLVDRIEKLCCITQKYVLVFAQQLLDCSMVPGFHFQKRPEGKALFSW